MRMALDEISQVRLQAINPRLGIAINQLAAMVEDTVPVLRITQGLRTWQEQDQIWRLGRNPNDPGDKPRGNIIAASQVKTEAPPGWSWHQFGLAVDVAPMDAEGQPDWNVNHPNWKAILNAGRAAGLVEGALWRTFPDNPHFQITGVLPASPDNETRDAFRAGGIPAVWKLAGLT